MCPWDVQAPAERGRGPWGAPAPAGPPAPQPWGLCVERGFSFLSKRLQPFPEGFLLPRCLPPFRQGVGLPALGERGPAVGGRRPRFSPRQRRGRPLGQPGRDGRRRGAWTLLPAGAARTEPGREGDHAGEGGWRVGDPRTGLAASPSSRLQWARTPD